MTKRRERSAGAAAQTKREEQDKWAHLAGAGGEEVRRRHLGGMDRHLEVLGVIVRARARSVLRQEGQ